VNERIDEQIGALLDGRVDERSRGELLSQLAADDDDYFVFADTAGVLREAEGGASEDMPEMAREEVEAPGSTPVIPLRAEKEAPGAVAPAEREVESPCSAPVIPFRPRRIGGWRSPAVRALAAAAVLAAIAVVPVLRSRSGGGWRDPARLAALASPAGARLPTEFDHAWNTTRGGSSDNIPNSGVAAQVGALHLDLVVAARSADPVDSGTVKQLARQAAVTLENAAETGPSFAAPKYREIVQLASWSRPGVLKRIGAARVGVLPFVDPDYFAVGAWTEAALLAEHRKDAAFFRTRESRKALEQTATMVGLTHPAREAAADLLGLQSLKEIKDWGSVEHNLETLQRELAH
jgi:hypothetical protein